MASMPDIQYPGTIAIPYEDEIVHTSINPFCPDMACPCHEAADLIEEVARLIQSGLLTQSEADRLFRGRQI